ncbi:SDR family NAD(P)-dependent oxidoreductase [Georgenia sp. AZ-5]|uniref:SDR family NAD(P)-dependent oxidoreductase n=1 Tax=Georgenia sp. AZ-5 TaxID=3367526 RepID=UPI003754D5A7
MGTLFAGKVALVTGGASGIGRATALRFAAEGAHVAVCDIDADGARDVATEIERAGGVALAVTADLARSSDIAAMVQTTVDRFGRLDAAFNNAGRPGPYAPITELAEDEWDATLDLNLKGVFLCMKHELLAMKGNGGAIVNTSSASILKPRTPQPDYQASKAGLVALTRNAAVAYGPQGVRVNAVLPGAVETPMLRAGITGRSTPLADMGKAFPLGRIGQPEEIANIVVWLCSDQASLLTGTAIPANGGAHLV